MVAWRPVRVYETAPCPWATVKQSFTWNRNVMCCCLKPFKHRGMKQYEDYVMRQVPSKYSGYWLYAYTTHYALSMCLSWIVCSCLVFPDENAGETCCLLRVDLKSLCISSCLRLTLKMLKDAEGRFWLAGHLVTHPFPWLSLTMKPFWYQEISMIYRYFNSSEVRSAKIWGPMSPSWFLDILCSFSSWCANTSTSLTSSSEVFGMLPFVTHVIHVKASKILRNFVEICQRLSPRLQIYAPYAAIPIHLQKQSRRIAHRNNRLFGRMSA